MTNNSRRWLAGFTFLFCCSSKEGKKNNSRKKNVIYFQWCRYTMTRRMANKINSWTLVGLWWQNALRNWYIGWLVFVHRVLFTSFFAVNRKCQRPEHLNEVEYWWSDLIYISVHHQYSRCMIFIDFSITFCALNDDPFTLSISHILELPSRPFLSLSHDIFIGLNGNIFLIAIA